MEEKISIDMLINEYQKYILSRLINKDYDFCKLREIAEKFNFNKPVYYIFDNISFNKAITMSSDCAQVVFKNCSFNKNVGIL